jgi:hypothetical protein
VKIGTSANSAAPTASIGAADRRHQAVGHGVLAPEQHFALVGEMAVEGPLGQTRAFGDLRDRRLIEPALAVQLARRRFEAAPRVGLPPDHFSSVGNVRD